MNTAQAKMSTAEVPPLEPWGAPVSHYNSTLQLSLHVPQDWKIEQTLDYPLRLIAPPRGQPPYSVQISVFCQPVPPDGATMLPIVAEGFFATNNNSDAPAFKEAPTTPLNIGPIKGFLKNSSWSETVGGNQTLEIRQQILVSQVRNSLYVFKVKMNAALTEVTSEVFSKMIKTASFHYEDDQPTIPTIPLAGSTSASLPETEQPNFADGVWRKRKRA